MNSTSLRLISQLHITALIACMLTSAVARAATPLPPDKVLVSNQQTSVTYAEFEIELARIPANDQTEFLMNRERLAKLVENLLINKTLALEARDHKLDQLPKVQAEIRNQTDRILAKYRGQQVQDEVPRLNYSAHARELYLANPERAAISERYEVWHALVTTKSRTKEQAQARAEEIRKRLLAGESRESLAQTLSDDPSAQTNNGDLPGRDLARYDRRFAEAVRKLKVGEVSPPFETPFGFHIAKLLGHVPAKRYTFDEMKQSLVEEAETQHLRTVWNEYLQRIQNDPKLKVDVEALDAIRPKMPDQLNPPPTPAANGTMKANAAP